jgi:hypothetical protein
MAPQVPQIETPCLTSDKDKKKDTLVSLGGTIMSKKEMTNQSNLAFEESPRHKD